ncbi:MAG: PAS domain-containing protein [Gammaproteobacteria bacterium]|nr:PAS domain-containing protein [Gammaproteobacteria bacterium]
MKQNIAPINREIVMRDDDFIVSKTSPKGLITYGNKIFIEFSGYTESELLGKQHNIVRHPDMPRAVFKLLWDTLNSGQEFNGYVKNLGKDGSFYWVFANVTPSYAADGTLLGYYSVRRKPKKEALHIMQNLYRDMLAAEQRTDTKNAIAASTQLLTDLLISKDVSYEKFILTL